MGHLRDRNETSLFEYEYEPFLDVVFPKLHHLEFNLDRLPNTLKLNNFLQSHTTLRSLKFWASRGIQYDISATILALTQLERLLFVDTRGGGDSIIAGLSQLKELKYLEFYAGD